MSDMPLNAFNACSSVSPSTQNAILSVVGLRQFTAMSDGGHGRLDNECVFADPEFIDRLATKGVRHIFLEVHSDQQEDVKAFYRDEISSKELQRRVGVSSALSSEERDTQRILDREFYENAKASGIQIHFIDPQPQIEKDRPDLAEIFWKITKQMQEGKITNNEQAGELAEQLGSSYDEINEFQQTLSRQRIDHTSG